MGAKGKERKVQRERGIVHESENVSLWMVLEYAGTAFAPCGLL
jgi:hypothetical protein